MGQELDDMNYLGDHNFQNSNIVQGFISKDK